ncbi:MAG: hypothetical protein ACLFUI_05955 [Halanaerobiales bacterium]
MDVFTLTILFIFISALIVVVVRKVKKDKCLKDFRKNTITLEKTDGKIVKGKLNVMSTGLEFIYPEALQDESGFCINSFLLYKSEYLVVQLLIRYLDDMSDKERDERDKDINHTIHPSRTRRYLRKLANFFRTIKDSILEIFNLVSNQVGKNTAAGMVMASQDKYISKVKNELFATVDNSFEPLLEKYIGYRVILELNRGDTSVKYKGILKRYTAEFIELIDVDLDYSIEYKESDEKGIQLEKEEQKDSIIEEGIESDEVAANRVGKKADLVVPRRYGIVRGLAEDWSYRCL